jgi:hypothetical protein
MNNIFEMNNNNMMSDLNKVFEANRKQDEKMAENIRNMTGNKKPATAAIKKLWERYALEGNIEGMEKLERVYSI